MNVSNVTFDDIVYYEEVGRRGADSCSVRFHV